MVNPGVHYQTLVKFTVVITQPNNGVTSEMLVFQRAMIVVQPQDSKSAILKKLLIGMVLLFKINALPTAAQRLMINCGVTKLGLMDVWTKSHAAQPKETRNVSLMDFATHLKNAVN